LDKKQKDGMNDPRPKAADVPEGWRILRSGKVKAGDKFWKYGRGTWETVIDRTTFLGSEAAGLMTTIVRKE
jgi:hypothetical protein